MRAAVIAIRPIEKRKHALTNAIGLGEDEDRAS